VVTFLFRLASIITFIIWEVCDWLGSNQPPLCRYRSRDQTVRSAYVTSLRIEGRGTYYLSQKYSLTASYEVLFIVWLWVHSCLLPLWTFWCLCQYQRTWNVQIHPAYCNRSSFLELIGRKVKLKALICNWFRLSEWVDVTSTPFHMFIAWYLV
jgi:hypothetical protein